MRPHRLALVPVLAACLVWQTAPAGAATTPPPLPQTTVISGVVSVVAVDRAEHSAGSSRSGLVTLTQVITSSGTLSVPPRLARGLSTGQKVSLTLDKTTLNKTTLNKTVAAAATSSAPTVLSLSPIATDQRSPGLRAQSTSTVMGQHTLTVLPVYWTNPDAQSQSSLTALAQRTSAYWARQSGAAIAVNGSSRDWKRIPAPAACDAAALFDAALAANAMAAPSDPHQHVAVYIPTSSQCSWAGLGTIGGSRIWMNGYALLDVLAHELGHNFGLGHANLRTCTLNDARVTLSSACTDQDYLDGADLMGYATEEDSGNLNTALADQLGLVKSLTVAAGGEAEADLYPLGQFGQLRAMKIAVPSGWIYVDYRPAAAPDLRHLEWAGVQVHYLPTAAYPQSYLLDLQPWSSSSFSAAAMPEHSTWRIPGTDIALSLNDQGATAHVRAVSISSDSIPPTAPTTTATRATDGALTVRWSPSSDVGTGLVGYRILVDNVVAALVAPQTVTARVYAAASAATVQVIAVDAAGNVSPGTISPLGGSGPDRSAPSTPVVTSPVIARTAQRSLDATITWNPSRDLESGIAGYRLTQRGSDSSSALPATARSTRVTLAANRSNVYELVAVNLYGLVSKPAVITVIHDDLAPKPVTQLARTPGTGFVTWRGAADIGSAVHFEVSLDGATWVRATSARSPKAANKGRHTWAVRVVDAAGNASTIVRKSAVVDVTAPSLPRARLVKVLKRASGQRAATLAWRPATDRDSRIVGYRIEIHSASTATPAIMRSVPAGTSRISVGLPSGEVWIIVRAENAGGTLSPASRITVRASQGA